MRSGPLELLEDGVVIGDGASIVEDELVVELVVVGHVHDLGLAELLLEFVHEFDLSGWGNTCLLRLWHSRKSARGTLQLVAG